MTQPGPWDAEHTDPGAPQPFPDTFPDTPAQPGHSRTGLMIAAVIAVVAVITAGTVLLLGHTRGSSNTASPTPAAPMTPVPPDQLHPVRIAAANVLTTPGTGTPLVTLSVYEDFLCPFCGLYEKTYGPAVTKMIDSGQVAVDYTMVSVLGRHRTTSYSVRAGAAAYCVADADKDAFRRFHADLFAHQPDEGGTTFPDDTALLSQATQAGAGGQTPDCVHSGRYLDMVNQAATTSKIQGTPTLLLNGKDIADELMDKLDPQVLIAKVDAITSNKQ